jgi:hypothetical protein
MTFMKKRDLITWLNDRGGKRALFAKQIEKSPQFSPLADDAFISPALVTKMIEERPTVKLSGHLDSVELTLIRRIVDPALRSAFFKDEPVAADPKVTEIAILRNNLSNAQQAEFLDMIPVLAMRVSIANQLEKARKPKKGTRAESAG